MRTNTLLTPCKQGAVLSRYFKTIELAAPDCDETKQPQAAMKLINRRLR